MSGMTNEGTHREPAFDGCQKCGDIGVMEGRLCGRLVRASDPALIGAQVTAMYRFAFEPSEKGGEGSLKGTIEGVVVRNCEPSKECVGFAVVGDDVNPRSVGGSASIETRDRSGPTAQTSVVTWGSTTGLHLWHSSTVTFTGPVSQVEVDPRPVRRRRDRDRLRRRRHGGRERDHDGRTTGAGDSRPQCPRHRPGRHRVAERRGADAAGVLGRLTGGRWIYWTVSRRGSWYWPESSRPCCWRSSAPGRCAPSCCGCIDVASIAACAR